jgi:hypothetical protein
MSSTRKPTRDLAGCATLCRSAGQHHPIAAANCARHSLAVRCQEMNIVDHSLALCMCRKKHSLAVLTDLEGRMFTFQTTNDLKVYTYDKSINAYEQTDSTCYVYQLNMHACILVK